MGKPLPCLFLRSWPWTSCSAFNWCFYYHTCKIMQKKFYTNSSKRMFFISDKCNISNIFVYLWVLIVVPAPLGWNCVLFHVSDLSWMLCNLCGCPKWDISPVCLAESIFPPGESPSWSNVCSFHRKFGLCNGYFDLWAFKSCLWTLGCLINTYFYYILVFLKNI